MGIANESDRAGVMILHILILKKTKALIDQGSERSIDFFTTVKYIVLFYILIVLYCQRVVGKETIENFRAPKDNFGYKLSTILDTISKKMN